MIWVIGVGASLAIATATILAIDATGPREMRPPPWDVSRTSPGQTAVVGTLAGLTVASAIFLSTQVTEGDPVRFETVIGILLLAFLQLVATAMQFAEVPSDALDEVEAGRQRSRQYSHLLSGVGF